MTIALSTWFLFKPLALLLAAMVFGAIAISLLIGGGLAALEKEHARWLPGAVLVTGLVFAGGFIITMNALAQVIMA
jgi:hypothetical protein